MPWCPAHACDMLIGRTRDCQDGAERRVGQPAVNGWWCWERLLVVHTCAGRDSAAMAGAVVMQCCCPHGVGISGKQPTTRLLISAA